MLLLDIDVEQLVSLREAQRLCRLSDEVPSQLFCCDLIYGTGL